MEKLLSDAIAEQNTYKDTLKAIQTKIDAIKMCIEAQRMDALASFAQFRKDRVRVNRESDDLITMAHLCKVYRYWAEARWPGEKLTQVQLLQCIEREFGRPSRILYQDRETYTGILAFDTDEDAEQYDEQQKL